MNFTQTFEEFSSKLSGMDLALYAGAALVLWVLFKDQLGAVTNFVKDLLGKSVGSLPKIAAPRVAAPKEVSKNDSDVFFSLVSSWKRTRDLAVLSGCQKAVDAADEMFPHLSPVTCQEGKNESTTVETK